jgi:hypothetical protein
MKLKSGSEEFVVQSTDTMVARRLQKRRLAYWLYENKIYNLVECAALCGISDKTFSSYYKRYKEGVLSNEE